MYCVEKLFLDILIKFHKNSLNNERIIRILRTSGKAVRPTEPNVKLPAIKNDAEFIIRHDIYLSF